MITFEQGKKKIDNRRGTRGRTQVIADILYQCKENKRKSHVMQKANLNFDQVNHYLDDLQSKGLLELHFTKFGRIYSTTDKGREFLDRYQQLMILLMGHISN
jgi:predicted transcriptional regulator